MSSIRSLEGAIHSIEHSKNKKIKRAAYKRLIAGALPAAVKSRYDIIKGKKSNTIRSHNATRLSKIRLSSANLEVGLTGKAGTAAKNGCHKLTNGNFTQGVDSL